MNTSSIVLADFPSWYVLNCTGCPAVWGDGADLGSQRPPAICGHRSRGPRGLGRPPGGATAAALSAQHQGQPGHGGGGLTAAAAPESQTAAGRPLQSDSEGELGQ